MRRLAVLSVCVVMAWAMPAAAQGDGPPPTPPPEPMSAPPPPPPVVDAPPPGPVTTLPQSGRRQKPEPPRRSNRLTFSPMSLFAIALGIEYERVINENVTFFIGPTFVGAGLVIRALTGISAFGGTLDTGVRIFPLKGDEAPMGFWTGPQVNFSLNSISGGGTSINVFSGSLLAMAGYTHVSDGGFTVSVGAGLGAAYGAAAITTTSTPTAAQPLLGVTGGLHLNVGAAF